MAESIAGAPGPRWRVPASPPPSQPVRRRGAAWGRLLRHRLPRPQAPDYFRRCSSQGENHSTEFPEWGDVCGGGRGAEGNPGRRDSERAERMARACPLRVREVASTIMVPWGTGGGARVVARSARLGVRSRVNPSGAPAAGHECCGGPETSLIGGAGMYGVKRGNCNGEQHLEHV